MTANWLKDLNLKPRSNSVKTFKSYVDLDTTQESPSLEEMVFFFIYLTYYFSFNFNMMNKNGNK